MRLFLAGLLVLNIGFAGWYWFIHESVTETVQVPPVDRGVEMLKLATEQQEVVDTDTSVAEVQQDTSVQAIAVAQPVAEEREVRASSPPATEKKDTRKQEQQAKARKSGNRQCFRMGMFEQKQDAEYRMTEMQALGYTVKLVTRYQRKAKYLVYLPAYPSYAAARKVTDQLRDSGQQDFQILTILGEKNSISLGVYSQPHTAEIRRKQIADLGYQPIVDPVYGGKPLGYNIEFSKKDGSDLTDSEKDFLLISEKKVSIEPYKCGS
jgi:hypothetical protein